MSDNQTSPNRSFGRKTIRPTLKPRELMTPTPDLKDVWKAKIITLFPTAFPGVLDESLTGKALQDGLWQLETIDLRAFGIGKHRNVDDTGTSGKWPLIYLSPRGKPMTQGLMQDLAKADGVTLLCGRFEGVDERVLDHYDIQEVSLGDFVMTGGEIAAQALIDATVRLLPNVLGNQESTIQESFSDGLLEHPQYTRPAVWRGQEIPEVLMSGHHGKIAEWRQDQSEGITRTRRPDLWARHKADDPDEQA